MAQRKPSFNVSRDRKTVEVDGAIYCLKPETGTIRDLMTRDYGDGFRQATFGEIFRLYHAVSENNLIGEGYIPFHEEEEIRREIKKSDELKIKQNVIENFIKQRNIFNGTYETYESKRISLIANTVAFYLSDWDSLTFQDMPQRIYQKIVRGGDLASKVTEEGRKLVSYPIRGTDGRSADVEVSMDGTVRRIFLGQTTFREYHNLDSISGSHLLMALSGDASVVETCSNLRLRSSIFGDRVDFAVTRVDNDMVVGHFDEDLPIIPCLRVHDYLGYVAYNVPVGYRRMDLQKAYTFKIKEKS